MFYFYRQDAQLWRIFEGRFCGFLHNCAFFFDFFLKMEDFWETEFSVLDAILPNVCAYQLILIDCFCRDFWAKMTKPRKYYQRKKLESMRVDLSLKKKLIYAKKIIELNEPYAKVRKDYLKDVGKDLPSSTYYKWKKNGKEMLKAGMLKN